MKKWEYLCLHITTMASDVIIGKLDEAGINGWELINIDKHCFYVFKREKVETITVVEGD